MENSLANLKKIKVDALYGKKKHFNAADRKESKHYWIGIPLIIMNVVTGSVLFFILTDGVATWVKYVPIVLAFVAAIFSAFQTYFNFDKKAEGNRRIGNRYLAIMKKCDRAAAYHADKAITDPAFATMIEEIAEEMASIDKDAEAFPTRKCDYDLAKKGIEGGEETYTAGELAI